ncbi:MAG: hypothetical protein PWR01_3989 [Clostridiales bacterium]|jgi:hypothetical protein|nr:hypothetical protein [Clostridiales bacterium]MDN5282916.1 hypothetical protein [Candidatus Ozemobacter sp.]
MKFDLNKKELEAMVELAMMAEWVMTSQDDEEDERKNSYISLINKIYHFASENGMKKKFLVDEENGIVEPDPDWEESVQAKAFIEEYENMNFWTELVNRLSDRDMQRKFKGREPKSFDEQLEVFQGFAEKYAQEFDENGMERLEIKKK